MKPLLIGITGTDGAGKGETVWETVARPLEIFFECAKKNILKVYCACKAPVPTVGNMNPVV